MLWTANLKLMVLDEGHAIDYAMYLYCVAIESTFLSATDDLFRFYRQLGMVALLTAFGNLVCFMFGQNNTYVPDITVGYQTIFHFF